MTTAGRRLPQKEPPKLRRTGRSGKWGRIPTSSASPLERLRRIEIGARDLDALRGQFGEKSRPHAGRLEMADYSAVGRRRGAYELEDLLHLNDVAFHAGEFRDAGHFALAVGEALQLDDHPNGAGDLSADADDGHRQAGHTDH